MSTQIAVFGDFHPSGQLLGRHPHADVAALTDAFGGASESAFPYAAALEWRVLEALQKLLAWCLRAPGVDLIDTGSDPGTGGMVLQVHVRNSATRFRLGPFEDIDGFPVRVIATEADLEA